MMMTAAMAVVTAKWSMLQRKIARLRDEEFSEDDNNSDIDAGGKKNKRKTPLKGKTPLKSKVGKVSPAVETEPMEKVKGSST